MLDLLSSDDARTRLRRGMQTTADAVALTLGPAGLPVLVANRRSPQRFARTGLAVAMAMQFHDRLESAGAGLIRQISEWTQDAAGDGTATAAVFAQIIADGVVGLIGTGFEPKPLRDGIALALELAEQQLHKLCRPADDIHALRNVAGTASGSLEIGRLVADVATRTGNGGLVLVEEAPWGEALGVAAINGIALQFGYTSPDVITSGGHRRSRHRLHRPLVVLVNDHIDDFQMLAPVLDHAKRCRRSLLIVAEGISPAFIASLRLAEGGTGTKTLIAIPPPGDCCAELARIAELTGATVTGRHAGRCVVPSLLDLGDASCVLADSRRTLIAGFDNTTPDQTRSLTVVRIGADTSEKAADMRVKAERAANAVHNAMMHGLVPGGGAALLSAAEALARSGFLSGDRYLRLGCSLVQRALERPFRALMSNAGFRSAQKMCRMSDNDEAICPGVNLPSGTIVDMISSGIVDSVWTLRAGLRAADCGVGLLFATDAISKQASRLSAN
jgi:chaperonin GroEL